jgi:hypothetical protein
MAATGEWRVVSQIVIPCRKRFEFTDTIIGRDTPVRSYGADLTWENFVRELEASVLEKGARARRRDMKIMNNEPKKLTKPGTERTRAPVVPAGRQAELGTNQAEREFTAEARRHKGTKPNGAGIQKSGARRCREYACFKVEKRENFHDFSRFFTFYHRDQARNSAIFALFRVGPSGAWNLCGEVDGHEGQKIVL